MPMRTHVQRPFKDRTTSTAQKQALAAVGQGRLIRLYDDMFSALDQVQGARSMQHALCAQ